MSLETRRDELTTAADACEADNERLRVEVLKLHAEIEELDEQPSEEADDALRRIRAMEQELAQLEATLAVMRSDDASDGPSVTRKPFIVAEEVARIGVEKTVAELQSALTWEEDRKDEEQVMLDRDKLYLRDAEALNAILSTRAAAASSASRRPTGESLVIRAQTHYDSLLARFRLLQSGLISFVDDVLADDASDARFHPRGVDTAVRKKAEARTSYFDLRDYLRSGVGDEADGGGRAFQLKKLIESLMNLSVTSSQEPYLPDTPTYPPELVEFLVRAGIAEEEMPDEQHTGGSGLARRIRLRDFGGLSGVGAAAAQDGKV